MTKGEDTKQGILELAAPVFNTKGYARAPLADILEATGLQKAACTITSAAKNSWRWLPSIGQWIN